MELQDKINAVNWFADYLKDKAVNNVLDEKAETLTDIFYEWIYDRVYEDERLGIDAEVCDKAVETTRFMEDLFLLKKRPEDKVKVKFWDGHVKVDTRSNILAWLWDAVVMTEGAEHEDNFNAYMKVLEGAKEIKL